MDNENNYNSDALFKKMLLLEWIIKNKNDVFYSTEIVEKATELKMNQGIAKALKQYGIIIQSSRGMYRFNKKFQIKDIELMAIELRKIINSYNRTKKSSSRKNNNKSKRNYIEIEPITKEKPLINKLVIVLLAIISLILLIKL